MKKQLFFLFVLAQIGLPIQRSILLKNSLVVNYDFSQSSSFSRASSTVANIAGTASGNAFVANGPSFMNSLGYVSFDGSTQYLVTPNLRTYFKSVNSSVQKSFTMSFWFYPTATSGVLVSELDSQTPSSGWHASNIELVNGVINYRVWSSVTPVVSSAITLNQWYHVALVYDGTSFKGYLNGVLQGAQSFVREIPTASQNYAIGAGESTSIGTTVYGKFNLAQFKMYNLPLSDYEISMDYGLRKSEFDYIVHSPTSNTNPTYWSVSSAWNSTTGSTGSPDPFGTNHFTPWLNSALGWAAQTLDSVNQFIALNYDEPVYIKGVVVQPRASSGGQWVKTAHIETSLNGVNYTRLLYSVPLISSITDDNYIKFTNPVFTKYIKLIPTVWNNHITLRMGLLVKQNTSSIVSNGLVLNLDPANSKSYQGSGSTLYDLTTSVNNATLTGSPTYSSSAGLTFNGTSQYGSIPSVAGVTDFTNTQKYSVEVWFNPSSGQATLGEAELLEKWNKNNESRYPFTIRYNEGTSSMTAACYDGTSYVPASASGFPVNTWKQLVAVFDFVSKTLTLYRDGSSVGSTSLAGVNQVSNTSPVCIAARLTSAGGAQSNIMFKGTIGIIRIYNTALTSDQVLQNFNVNKIRYGL
jgi:hypothetical protein